MTIAEERQRDSRTDAGFSAAFSRRKVVTYAIEASSADAALTGDPKNGGEHSGREGARRASSSGQSVPKVRRAIATYGANLGATGASLINLLIVARVLGPAGRGEIALLIVIGGFTTILSSLGISEANANLGGRSPEAIPRLATNSVVFAFLLGSIAAGVVVVASLVIPSIARHADRGLLWFNLASVPLQILGIYFKYLLNADYCFRITNIAWILSPVATAVIDGILALCGALTVQTAMVCWVFTGIAATFLLGFYVHRHYGFGRADFALARASLSFGIKTHFGTIMSMGNYRADQWLLGAMAGPHALGLYSVAVTWSEGLWYVPGVITLVQRPDLVRATPQHAAELASRVMRRAVALAIVAGAALFLAAPLLCVTAFGHSFHGSIIELRVLALGALGVVAMDLLSNAVIAQGKPLLASGADGAALVCTVVLNLLLIPHLGGLGSAIATSAAYTFGGLVMAVIFLRVLNTRARDLIPRPADLTWYWRKAQSELRAARRLPGEPSSASVG